MFSTIQEWQLSTSHLVRIVYTLVRLVVLLPFLVLVRVLYTRYYLALYALGVSLHSFCYIYDQNICTGRNKGKRYHRHDLFPTWMVFCSVPMLILTKSLVV